MQSHWLKAQNKDKLIIFFSGWSFDENPFLFLESSNYDVLMLYDYNNLNIENLNIPNNYKEYYLISWSMGVYTAFLLRNKLPKFAKKIAINGTLYPVDDKFGIPQKSFILTLRHAKIGLEGKFYQNIFTTENEYKRYINEPVKREIDNRVSELKSLFETIKNTEIIYNDFYNMAIISNNDKIIPTKNQIYFWENKIPIKIIESGHFPYYNYNSWDQIICN